MNILHVTSSYYPAHHYGGSVTAVDALCRSLATLGCEVKVLTTDSNGIDTTILVNTNSEVCLVDRLHVRYCRRWFRHAISPSLIRWLPRYVQWADVVHLTGVYNFPILPTLIIAKILGKPVVWWPHGVLQRWKGSRRRHLKALWELICRSVMPRRIMFHLTSTEEAVATNRRFPGVKGVVIPLCLEMPEQVNHIDANGRLRLLFLGRLDPKKGIENLLDACAILNGRAKFSWSLIIAGEGESRYVKRLQREIQKRNLSLGGSSEVRMVGEVVGELKERLFDQTDILVVPSYTENFAIVVAEALAHAIPVIASTGTPWQRIEEVGCGLWVDNDPGSLADAIERMSVLPLQEMGRYGRDWAKKEFSAQEVGQAMVACYQRMATTSHSVPLSKLAEE